MNLLFKILFVFIIFVSNLNAEKIMISDELRKFVNGDKVKYQILYQIPFKSSIWLEAVPEGSEKAATEGIKVNGVKSDVNFIELISSEGFVVSKKGMKKAAREQKKAHTKDKSSAKSSC